MVQLIQYYYQSGCLYRLRALGERSTDMYITVGKYNVGIYMSGVNVEFGIIIFLYFQLFVIALHHSHTETHKILLKIQVQ